MVKENPTPNACFSSHVERGLIVELNSMLSAPLGLGDWSKPQEDLVPSLTFGIEYSWVVLALLLLLFRLASTVRAKMRVALRSLSVPHPWAP